MKPLIRSIVFFHFLREKRNLFQSVAQGRFKKSIPFSQIWTGNAYDEELPSRPTKWLVSGVAKLQPGFQFHLEGSKPYFLSPLMSTSQHVMINRPGQEPGLSDSNYGDNLSLLGSEFQGMPERKRKAFFSQR